MEIVVLGTIDKVVVPITLRSERSEMVAGY